jgi:putative hydrolase of the HAD superfamily
MPRPLAISSVRLTGVAPELLLFDFDGTLAHRPGMWTRCLLEVLERHRPGHGVTFEDLRPHLRDGFPWHRHEVAHPELADPDAWWDALGVRIDDIYLAVGIDPTDLAALRDGVRRHYCDPTRFELYPDTLDALELVSDAGCRAVLLSNHVPELRAIVRHLGLEHAFDDILTSATTGFEKPHPEAFRLALGGLDPSKACMIGDNPIADKEGAERAGMRAVLVRHATADHATVFEAVAVVLAEGTTSGGG